MRFCLIFREIVTDTQMMARDVNDGYKVMMNIFGGKWKVWKWSGFICKEIV